MGEPILKPVVVLSHCLADEACRYNGEALRDPLVARLAPFVTFKPVCPEVAIGLGTPRDPIRLVSSKSRVRLLQPSTGADVTDRMNGFATRFLDGLGDVDGFLLKNRSPSCGIGDVKLYVGPAASKRTSGLFGAAILARFSLLAVEDEGRLTNFDIREHFLTRVFSHRRWRELRRRPSMAGLVAFQAANKLLLLSHSERRMRELGRVAANADAAPIAEVFDRYEPLLGQALAAPARRTSRINVWQHAFGFVSERLSASEKRHFLALIERYRARRVPHCAIAALVRSWILRFDVAWLGDQTIFEPYPEELVELSDSGRGRGPE